MSLFHLFTKTKDHALNIAGKTALRKWFAPYGIMLDLAINTQNKTISASILLKGEVEPITVELKKYQLEEQEGCTFVSFNPADVSISREWMNQLAAEKLKSNRIEIPAQYSWVIKLLA